jgi:FtsP/CotA-like multicopper oxidase with cupredoxin domain
VSVDDLRGTGSGAVTVRYTLTASPETMRDANGKPRHALAFNGQVPGPRLSAHVGDLVEVTLRNNGVRDGVSIHWHGYDVPNAEDGVAGVTQDAVRPGGSYVYRFRATRAGTYWYHSHQSSAVEVNRGLYGALVVAGVPHAPGGEDLTVVDGRYDLTFTVPSGAVTLTGLGDGVRLVLGSGPPAGAAGSGGPGLDLLTYGSPAATPFGAGSRFDRDFRLVMGRRLGFLDGRLGYQWTVNGRQFPRMPMLMVAEGDLVRMTFVNRSTADHPMHLHGHHVLVLARNDKPATGSPWWTDTLNVAPGETYTVAFRADNPGVWMDHCHDLRHAAAGFVTHLAYQGVSAPYRVGDDTPNRPE